MQVVTNADEMQGSSSNDQDCSECHPLLRRTRYDTDCIDDTLAKPKLEGRKINVKELVNGDNEL